jgi:hypothetical protein
LGRQDLFIYSKVKVSEARLLLGRGESKYLVNIKGRELEKSFAISVEGCKPSGAPFVYSDGFLLLNVCNFFLIYSKKEFPEQ